MAQLGYVVIACWKNNSKNGSPHFVTLFPCQGKYIEKDMIQVAHVGGTYTDVNRTVHHNEIRNLSNAFTKNSLDDINFYCNIKQVFK